jgi:hypothetical protein
MGRLQPLFSAVTLMGFSGAAYGGCEIGTKTDASIADMAKRKIEHAGSRSVRDLKKGCDNFRHGKAVKDGVEAVVVLSPPGDVMPKGD